MGPAERFWGKISTEGECWIWQGAVTGAGYGSFAVREGSTVTHYSPHRLAWELVSGEPLGDLSLFHLCGVRLCCKPDHLVPVSRRQSARWAGALSHAEES